MPCLFRQFAAGGRFPPGRRIVGVRLVEVKLANRSASVMAERSGPTRCSTAEEYFVAVPISSKWRSPARSRVAGTFQPLTDGGFLRLAAWCPKTQPRIDVGVVDTNSEPASGRRRPPAALKEVLSSASPAETFATPEYPSTPSPGQVAVCVWCKICPSVRSCDAFSSRVLLLAPGGCRYSASAGDPEHRLPGFSNAGPGKESTVNIRRAHAQTSAEVRTARGGPPGPS